MRVLTEAIMHQAEALVMADDVNGLADLTFVIDDGSWESAIEISGLLAALGMNLSSLLWYEVATHRKLQIGVVSLN